MELKIWRMTYIPSLKCLFQIGPLKFPPMFGLTATSRDSCTTRLYSPHQRNALDTKVPSVIEL